MNTIQKLTVTYDENEDRLHFAALRQDGEVQGLWLTQRLANLLVRALLKRLGESRAPAADPHTRAVYQAWEQSAASSQHRGSAPVDVAAGAPHGLIDSVSVMQHADGEFRLVFRWDGAQALAFPIGETTLRQWLGILRQHYRTADWPSADVWPNWFDAVPAGPHRAATASVH